MTLQSTAPESRWYSQYPPAASAPTTARAASRDNQDLMISSPRVGPARPSLYNARSARQKSHDLGLHYPASAPAGSRAGDKRAGNAGATEGERRRSAVADSPIPAGAVATGNRSRPQAWAEQSRAARGIAECVRPSRSPR